MSRIITTTPQPKTGLSVTAPEANHFLPDEPLVSIEPATFWSGANLSELWSYRELLYFLIWRDVKVRYKQTVLGAVWALLQPLLLMLIFNFFFSRLAGIKTSVPYPLFAYAGLLPWVFFANAVTNGGNSLIGSTNLITKVYFPRMLIPLAAVIACLVDLAIAFLLFVILLFYYDLRPQSGIVMLPLPIILLIVLAMGVSLLLSALNVKYRDIRYALPFMIQVWMFASPVIYPIPDRWRWLLALNPLTGIIEAFRGAFFGGPLDWLGIGLAAVLTLLILTLSFVVFSRMERSFADVI